MNWLLVRGLVREQRHWHGFRDVFAERMHGARIHFVDVAGAGTEHGALPLPSVRWMARDVARRLPALAGPKQEGERWSVLGLSLGGMIALELCRMFPRRIDLAVIVNSSSRLTSVRARMRPASALRLIQAASLRDPLQREQIIMALTSARPEAERALYADRAAEFARDARPARAAVLAQLIAAARFVPPAPASVRARLDFICSRHDRLVHPRCTRDLAAWFASPCADHPWAGHDLPLDDPAWLCDHIARLAASSGPVQL